MDLSEIRNHSDSRHPWEIARAGAFTSIVDSTIDSRRAIDWLDVGSGDGYTAARILNHLPEGSTITCFDIHYEDSFLANPAKRHEGVEFTAEVPKRRFDVVSMFDVIEHVEDDAAFLDDAVEDHLQPGGTVFVSVPAYQTLFSSHDTALRHHRRYSSRTFAAITPTRLRRRTEGGLFLSLLPIRAVQKLIEGLRPTRPSDDFGVGTWDGGPLLTKLLTTVLTIDARFSLAMAARGLRIPGLSYWAVFEDVG